jgi:hypothetical protein
MATVWVFNGTHASFPAAVFTALDKAEAWIAAHRLSGTLSEFPLDVGVWDWAVEQGTFHPRDDSQRAPDFVGRFSSAGQQHHHYEDGARCV